MFCTFNFKCRPEKSAPFCAYVLHTALVENRTRDGVRRGHWDEVIDRHKHSQGKPMYDPNLDDKVYRYHFVWPGLIDSIPPGIQCSGLYLFLGPMESFAWDVGLFPKKVAQSLFQCSFLLKSAMVLVCLSISCHVEHIEGRVTQCSEHSHYRTSRLSISVVHYVASIERPVVSCTVLTSKYSQSTQRWLPAGYRKAYSGQTDVAGEYYMRCTPGHYRFNFRGE